MRCVPGCLRVAETLKTLEFLPFSFIVAMRQAGRQQGGRKGRGKEEGRKGG